MKNEITENSTAVNESGKVFRSYSDVAQKKSNNAYNSWRLKDITRTF
ncbi:hypothetical protein [Psychroflexus sp. ALD_RP9]|nr:hypothetical protein [Psychroflexus sp. ALD_RP9]QSS96693.1 hypothetical protein IMZ30_09590 [Psychroflexus sp. ALD_RP9]